MMKDICVFIPIKNGMPLIVDTLHSIIRQREFFDGKIKVVVCDGQSTDGTLEYIRSVADLLGEKGIDLTLISRKDSGMYDALAFGMSQPSLGSDIYCYINAGDYFSPYAFDVVSKVLIDECSWLTGMTAFYNNEGALISLSLPVFYSRSLIKKGFYGTHLPFLQQESIFWNAKLQKKINLNLLSEYKYAGDFFIWKTFADHADLFILKAWISGFRSHEGQLSISNAAKYRDEFNSIASKKTLASYLFAGLIYLLFRLPDGWKLKISKKIIKI